MPITVPNPIAAYLAADKAHDREMLAQCFTADAHVHDEDHDYVGTDAIWAWKQKSQTEYQYTVEPVEVVENGPKVLLRAQVTGTFPGSPVVLKYTFTLAGGKIARLEIQ